VVSWLPARSCTPDSSRHDNFMDYDEWLLSLPAKTLPRDDVDAPEFAVVWKGNVSTMGGVGSGDEGVDINGTVVPESVMIGDQIALVGDPDIVQYSPVHDDLVQELFGKKEQVTAELQVRRCCLNNFESCVQVHVRACVINSYMITYIQIYIHIHTHIHTYTHAHTHTHLHTHIHTHKQTHVVHSHIRASTCTHKIAFEQEAAGKIFSDAIAATAAAITSAAASKIDRRVACS